MNGTNWWAALGLMLVAEGLIPFLRPTAWRELFSKLLLMSDGQIRFIGLLSVLGGLGLLWLMAG